MLAHLDPSTLMRICVYCASSAQAPRDYGDAAERLGRLIAEAGHTLVFGGGGVGSMGRLADGAHAAGGDIVGIMPDFMQALENAHPKVARFTWTRDMAERKALLLRDSDAVVALPGGCGTLEELLEAITLKRLGLYCSPIVVVNQGGYFDPLIAQFQRSVEEAFMRREHLRMFSVVDSVEAVLQAVADAPRWGEDARDIALQR